MRKSKKILTFLLVLTLLCGLTVPASADLGVPSASAGDTTIRDSNGYVHTLSNPILYTWKKPLFNDLPKTHDFFWMDESDRYEGPNHDVFVVPQGTVLHVDKSLWLWDYYDCNLVLRDGTWYRSNINPTIMDENSNEGLTEFTFSHSGAYYRIYFTLKSNPAEYGDTVFFYVPGEDAAFQAPASYQPDGGTSSKPAAETPAQAAGSPAWASSHSEPAKANNGHRGNYDLYATTVNSYLYVNGSGGLTRVENTDAGVVVEDYDRSFNFLSGHTIKRELSIFGGFFAGEHYNFLLFGQNNPQESDSVEVMRIVKYSKSWQRLGSASVYGANTKEVFHSGSLWNGPARCAEYNGTLYVRTCHLMYKSSDGKNHQANMTVVLNQQNMEVLGNSGGSGYVSHSFNQFIIVDENGAVVTLDHGDAYPRAAVLHRYQVRTDGILNPEEEINIQEFPGAIGYNYTGAALGGLAETSSGYLTAYNYDGIAGSNTFERHIYISYTAKDGLTTTNRRVSSITGGATPKLYPTGMNGGYIVWNQYDRNASDYTSNAMYYAAYSADGSIGELKQTIAMVSDCQPVFLDGKLVWYAGIDAKPVFYTLDASGVTTHGTGGQASSGTPPFKDVATSAYYYDAVLWALNNGVTTGVTADQFQPGAACTRGQVVTFLWRAKGSPEPKTTVNPFTDVSSTSPFYKAILWAYENNITSGNTLTTFNPGGTCSSGHVVTFLWRAENQPAAAKSSALAQKYPNAYYTDAVAWADTTGLLEGTGTAFQPTAQATRANIVTYLYRNSNL